MSKTKRELEQEIERLKAELNQSVPALMCISGKAVKIMGGWFIGRGRYKGGGRMRRKADQQEPVPVVLVKETK